MTPLPRAPLSRAVLAERLPGYVGQALLVALVVWIAWHGVANFVANVRARGVPVGFGFLHGEAGFQIAQTLIAFGPGSTYLDAIIAATLNTLLVIALAGVLSTLIALVVAFGRLARHPLARGAATGYVEVFRNIPLLLQIYFWYFSAIALLPSAGDSLQLADALLNNRGLFLPRLRATSGGAIAIAAAVIAFVAAFALARRRLRTRGFARGNALALAIAAVVALAVVAVAAMRGAVALDAPHAEGFDVTGGVAVLPELMALTLGLSIYNGAFLAEIFRAGIQSVPRGQIEAAATIGLTGMRAALLVTLPQAMRLALPPAIGQYQTLAKASSLAAAIGYPDIMQIVGGTVLSQTSQALEAMALVVLLYAAINLAIALAGNLQNRRLVRREARR